MEDHVEVPGRQEPTSELVGVGRIGSAIRRPFAAVARRVLRFLIDRQVVADIIDRRLAIGGRIDGLEGRLNARDGEVVALADGLGRLGTDTAVQVASLARDLAIVSESMASLSSSIECVRSLAESAADSAQLESAMAGIRELQLISTDERGRLDALVSDLAGVAATVASRHRAFTADAPLDDDLCTRLDGLSSVWPRAALEAYVRGGQALGVAFSPEPTLPAPPSEFADLLASLRLDGGTPDDIAAYLYDSHWRFLHTLGLVDDERTRVLELGANPYFTTVLLWEYRGLDPELANYFGLVDVDAGTQLVEYIGVGEMAHSREVEFRHFNIEQDRFPYVDETFDLVLFCEILEHLLDDPVAVLTEVNRVLADDGHLVVTTPNVARAENVARLINGDNLYDPYSGFGPYGRHNREYTLDELVALLEFSGFRVDRRYTADGHPWFPDVDRLEVVRPELEARAGDLGQYLFVRATKVGPPKSGRPEFLYRSLQGDEAVTREPA